MERDDAMGRAVAAAIRLRRTERRDLPLLFAFECDEASNDLAGTKPRDWPTFRARWEEILADTDGGRTGVTPRVVVAGEADEEIVLGSVNISPHEGRDTIGYWIDRPWWGRGVASRAIALMLADFPQRPIEATASAHNAPSIRVLERNGFRIVDRRWTPESARTIARETVTLVCDGRDESHRDASP